MRFIKTYPWLVVVVIILGAEAWVWWQAEMGERKAMTNWRQKLQERDRLMAQSPALNEANEQLIADDLSAARKMLSEMRETLTALSPLDRQENVSAQPLDLYFALTSFVERSHTAAAQAGVNVRKQERFSFASHTRAGPAMALMPAVWRQHLFAEIVVNALFEARPQALLSVKRSRPTSTMARADVAPVTSTDAIRIISDNAPENAEDFFEMEPALSLRVAGKIDSDAFRVEFAGSTAALRAFLNALPHLRALMVVRSVEVEPLRADAIVQTPLPRTLSNESTLIISAAVSKFVVVIECLALLPQENPPTA